MVSNVKGAVKAVVPARIRPVIRRFFVLPGFLTSYLYDLTRYYRLSSSSNVYRSRNNLASRITATYHNLEKGLSLPNPRKGFGLQAIGDLLNYLQIYLDRYEADNLMQVAGNVLREYLSFNSDRQPADIPHYGRIMSVLERIPEAAEVDGGGTKLLTLDQVKQSTDQVNIDFFQTRSSVRQFSSVPVSDADLEYAALVARTSPAVCNRQSGQLHIYRHADDIEQIASIQGGARGFSDQLGGVAVVTTSLTNFWGPEERNQAFTDGGMFAMAFLLGLHSRSLGAVCLNWSKRPEKDREMREYLKLDESMQIVMLIGFGSLKKETRVAKSYRPPLTDILKLH